MPGGIYAKPAEFSDDLQRGLWEVRGEDLDAYYRALADEYQRAMYDILVRPESENDGLKVVNGGIKNLYSGDWEWMGARLVGLIILIDQSTDPRFDEIHILTAEYFSKKNT